jgi:hypothetical protein
VRKEGKYLLKGIRGRIDRFSAGRDGGGLIGAGSGAGGSEVYLLAEGLLIAS